jgi:hypothetical protein
MSLGLKVESFKLGTGSEATTVFPETGPEELLLLFAKNLQDLAGGGTYSANNGGSFKLPTRKKAEIACDKLNGKR